MKCMKTVCSRIVSVGFFFVKQKTAYEMVVCDWKFRRVRFRSKGIVKPATLRRMNELHSAIDEIPERSEERRVGERV